LVPSVWVRQVEHRNVLRGTWAACTLLRPAKLAASCLPKASSTISSPGIIILYSSGSNFCQVTVPVPYLDHKKHFSKSFGEKCWPFYISKLLYHEKIDNFHQIDCKMWTKKILTEGNQIHNFTLCVCENFCVRFKVFDTLLSRFQIRKAKTCGSYGSGSTKLVSDLHTQCDGSGILIPDPIFFPFRIPNPISFSSRIPDPQRI
jgi:hypothetical protein